MIDDDDVGIGPTRLIVIKIVWGLALAVLAIAAVYGFFVATARADDAPQSIVGQCGPFGDLSKALKDVAHEDQVAGGLITGDNVLVIFASPKGETWTAVMVTIPEDKACVLSIGVGWFPVPAAKGSPV